MPAMKKLTQSPREPKGNPFVLVLGLFVFVLSACESTATEWTPQEIVSPDGPVREIVLERFEDSVISLEEVFSSVKRTAEEMLRPIQLVQYRGVYAEKDDDFLARSLVRTTSALIQAETADDVPGLDLSDLAEETDEANESESPGETPLESETAVENETEIKTEIEGTTDNNGTTAEESTETTETKAEKKEKEEANVAVEGESTETSTPAPPRRAPQLGPEVLQLHRQIKATLGAYSQKPLSLGGNTPADLINYSFVFGADAKVLQGNRPDSRQRGVPQGNAAIYTIGSLCWNYPGAGLTLLRADGRNVIAKVGPGLQRKPSLFLAMLAMSSIAENYEIRIQDRSFSVTDLVRSEKESCSLDADMSLTLVGLSFYCNCEERWNNRFGETWTIPRMVFAELCRPAEQGNSQITDQLLGLACAVRRFENEGVALAGPMLDAKKYLDSYVDFALTAMNEQGLWHPRFFLYKGVSNDARETLYSSGHIFRFVAFQIPEERLGDPKLLKGASALLALVGKIGQTQTTTERQYESLTTALHGLAVYAERLDVFLAELDAATATPE